MSIFLSLLLSVHANPVIPKRFLPTSIHLEGHGPDGPPPDGGYEIQNDSSGNTFGKLGVLCLAGGVASAVAMQISDQDSENHEKFKNAAIGLSGAGVGFLVFERVF